MALMAGNIVQVLGFLNESAAFLLFRDMVREALVPYDLYSCSIIGIVVL